MKNKEIQNNGTSANELDNIIKEIMESVHSLDKENAGKIIDMLELTKEELSKFNRPLRGIGAIHFGYR